MRRTTGRSWSRSRRRRAAGTRRIIFLSVPGADPDHQHPFLRAKGHGRAMRSPTRGSTTRSCGAPTPTGSAGCGSRPPSTERWRRRRSCAARGRQELAPVLADDIGAVVAAMDDRADPLGGTWGLEGPDVADRRCASSRCFATTTSAATHADGQAAAAALTDAAGRTDRRRDGLVLRHAQPGGRARRGGGLRRATHAARSRACGRRLRPRRRSTRGRLRVDGGRSCGSRWTTASA